MLPGSAEMAEMEYNQVEDQGGGLSHVTSMTVSTSNAGPEENTAGSGSSRKEGSGTLPAPTPMHLDIPKRQMKRASHNSYISDNGTVKSSSTAGHRHSFSDANPLQRFPFLSRVLSFYGFDRSLHTGRDSLRQNLLQTLALMIFVLDVACIVLRTQQTSYMFPGGLNPVHMTIGVAWGIAIACYTFASLYFSSSRDVLSLLTLFRNQEEVDRLIKSTNMSLYADVVFIIGVCVTWVGLSLLDLLRGLGVVELPGLAALNLTDIDLVWLSTRITDVYTIGVFFHVSFTAVFVSEAVCQVAEKMAPSYRSRRRSRGSYVVDSSTYPSLPSDFDVSPRDGSPAARSRATSVDSPATDTPHSADVGSTLVGYQYQQKHKRVTTLITRIVSQWTGYLGLILLSLVLGVVSMLVFIANFNSYFSAGQTGIHPVYVSDCMLTFLFPIAAFMNSILVAVAMRRLRQAQGAMRDTMA